MPSGKRKRPDTLELEVLGGARQQPQQRHHHNLHQRVESSEDDDDDSVYIATATTKQCHPTKCVKLAKPQTTFHVETGPSQTPNTTRPQQIADPPRRRWFQFERKSRRRLRREQRREADSEAERCSIQAPTTTTAVITSATLAKPEPTTIANSANTIVSSQTIPDVAAVAATKQRRHSRTPKTESLNSLATLAQTYEIQQQQQQPKSAPNVNNGGGEIADLAWTNAHTRPTSAAAVAAKEMATAEGVTGIFLAADCEKRRDQTLLTSAEDAIDGAEPSSAAPSASGFRVSLVSVLNKLAIWKRSNCVRRRRRSHSISSRATSGSGSDGISGGGAHKSLNVSSDFEPFPTEPSVDGGAAAGDDGDFGSGVFARVKQKSIRRLSQIRRRRSSYYFSDNERRIRANDREFNSQFKYTDNYIKTSKYSPLTFLPFNLLEQFQRLANFYFLCLLVLQLIPAISSLTPVTTAIPLIGVLTLTAVKDAYDDIQRHMSDSQVNNRRSKTLRNGKLVDEKWSGVQVGDIIRMENNQFVAADILILTTSEPNGLCFIETAELDGETNLKCKQCLSETIELGQQHDLLWNFNGEILCERPNNLLNKFEGTLIWKNQRYSLDNEKILLRGCVLRNTQWCYGVVIFAGKDTKLMQNSGKTQFKSTGVDRLLNFIIIGIVLFLLSICTFFALACAIWEGLIGQHFQVYLPWENIIPKNVAQGATVIGFLVFFSYAIVLNTVVPISLYVSVEVIRFIQSFLINWDEKMYYERTKTYAKSRTTTLNEELGQIQYIFSDKTGTLTQNIMTFNKCSINGRTYGDVFDLRTGEVIEVTEKQNTFQNTNSNNKNKSTKSTAPTILVHTAEVHPKNPTMLTAASTPSKSLMTISKTAPTTPMEQLQHSYVHTETASTSPSSSKGQTKRVQYAANTYPRDHTTTPKSPSSRSPSRSPSPPSSWSSSYSARRPRLRRQLSTMSNTSDKVMILSDDAMSYKKTLIVANTNYNNYNNHQTNNKNNIITSITNDASPTLSPTTTSTTITAQAATTTAQPVNNTRKKLTTTTITTPALEKSILRPNVVETTDSNKRRIGSSITNTITNASLCAPFCSCNHQQQQQQQQHQQHQHSTTTYITTSTITNTSNCDFFNKYTNTATKLTTACTTQQNTLFNTNTATCTNRTTNWSCSSHQKVHALEPVDFSANPEYEPEFRWYDNTLLDAVRSDEEHAHTFFRLLALCHTVMPEYVEGNLEYQAQSPDEAALVSAARNFGFVFRSRTPNSITIEVMGHTEEYELLSILDFNNIRKRMSVILRRGDHVFLYCKGADNVIYDRLSPTQHDMKARTQEHLNKFAGEGLRTLVLAERHLDLDYFNDWRDRQQEASLTLDNREDKLNAMYEEIESEMVLVGVTAIEDKLQDGVPQTIANLQMAGIKIWVLTGDKQETAINIGYSCQLLTDELADVFIVDGSSMEEVEKQLRQFKESIRIVNRFRPTPLEPTVNLNLNGSNFGDRNNSSLLHHAGGSLAFRSQVSPPPPPAISVVTFRWDDDNIKRNKGVPDSAECNELYDNLEKGGDTAAALTAALHESDDAMEENTGFAIVVNGNSLVYCLSPELEAKFLDIASQCKAVICCRVTPLQKALVVELIKRAKNAVTLAIGDGANDVSMIKAAHIGVGISGQEGLQAVLASDYSIAQFRYLERLLLVHGRWSYYRMCKFLRYFFYKNFAFTLCHCWYSFFCGFSAQTVFDPMFISVYNLFYTSLPVLALGVIEQDVSDKHSVDYPKLYAPGLKNQLFNTKEFVYSVLHGAFSSLILFLIPYGTYKDGVSPSGYILSDHMTLGAVVATILIIDNTAQIALYTSYWTIANHIMIWGSLIWYFVLDYFYNYVIGGPYVGSLTQAMKDLTFWATMFLTVSMLMAPVLAYKFYMLDVHPSLTDKVRIKRRQASIRARHPSNVMRTPSSRRARRSLRSGYAFAHQEGFGRLITSGKIMRKLPQELAFPLGLGTKKVQNATPVTSDSSNDAQTRTNQNNNNSTKDNNDIDGAIGGIVGRGAGGGSGAGIGGGTIKGSEEDLSPRAPCQDLDTINL